MRTPKKKKQRISTKTFLEIHEECLVPNREYRLLWKPYEQKCLYLNYAESIPSTNHSFTNGIKSF
jgi:hypothetical protein